MSKGFFDKTVYIGATLNERNYNEVNVANGSALTVLGTIPIKFSLKKYEYTLHIIDDVDYSFVMPPA